MSQIEKVRQSIQRRQRKRMQNIPEGDLASDYKQIVSIQEEEKHGYLPFPDNLFPNSAEKKKKSSRGIFNSYTLLKLLLSIALFASTVIILQLKTFQNSEVSSWLNKQLTEDFPFAKVTKLYENHFGAPLNFLNEEDDLLEEVTSMENGYALPVNGEISESFEENGKGIYIKTFKAEPIRTTDDGIVVFNGQKDDTNKTIVIQHADGSKTTYGNLPSVSVHLYEHVRKNEIIGSFKEDDDIRNIFYSIEKNEKFINPLEAEPVSGTERE